MSALIGPCPYESSEVDEISIEVTPGMFSKRKWVVAEPRLVAQLLVKECNSLTGSPMLKQCNISNEIRAILFMMKRHSII